MQYGANTGIGAGLLLKVDKLYNQDIKSFNELVVHVYRVTVLFVSMKRKLFASSFIMSI